MLSFISIQQLCNWNCAGYREWEEDMINAINDLTVQWEEKTDKKIEENVISGGMYIPLLLVHNEMRKEMRVYQLYLGKLGKASQQKWPFG